jgi:hypothetical protein
MIYHWIDNEKPQPFHVHTFRRFGTFELHFENTKTFLYGKKRNFIPIFETPYPNGDVPLDR